MISKHYSGEFSLASARYIYCTSYHKTGQGRPWSYVWIVKASLHQGTHSQICHSYLASLLQTSYLHVSYTHFALIRSDANPLDILVWLLPRGNGCILCCKPRLGLWQPKGMQIRNPSVLAVLALYTKGKHTYAAQQLCKLLLRVPVPYEWQIIWNKRSSNRRLPRR